jgi:Holliday junction resolvasome RuvABC endonuclease subunit
MPKITSGPILAIDPGLRDLGYAVLAGHRLVARDVIPLRLVPKARRLGEAKARIVALARAHRPKTIVVEKTYRHPVPWLNDLHHITQAARRLAVKQRLAFATYAPQSVRQSVAGHGWAKKSEAAIAVAHRFPSLRVYLTQDRRWKEKFWLNMFDAVALALHHQAVANPPSRSRDSG